MSDPIVLEFEVEAAPAHAFDVWTRLGGSWWPPSHSMSQSDDFDVVFEPFEGGRIYEMGPDGSEYDWGEVVIWEPPHRLEYLWHIFLDPEKATRVSVRFEPAKGATIVHLENSGFEVFGSGEAERRQRVGSAWSGITEHYRQAV